jgi:hypothetical protein
LMQRTIRLEAGTTKKGEGRVVTVVDALYVLISACVRGSLKTISFSRARMDFP